MTGCTLLERAMLAAARVHPEVKFMKIVATQCIENFPDSKCPAVLLYHVGGLVKQIIGIAAWGGSKCAAEGARCGGVLRAAARRPLIDPRRAPCADVEWVLSQQGACDTELTEDPLITRGTLRPEDARCALPRLQGGGGGRGGGRVSHRGDLRAGRAASCARTGTKATRMTTTSSRCLKVYVVYIGMQQIGGRVI